MAARYRKRPVVIEAVQWLGDNQNELASFMGVAGFVNNKVEINTLEGTLTAAIGDWIIKGVKGEFYPCDSTIFQQTYEQVA